MASSPAQTGDRAFNWIPRERDYSGELNKLTVKRQLAESHPLSLSTVIRAQSQPLQPEPTLAKKPSSADPLAVAPAPLDPLTATPAFDDPLSAMLAAAIAQPKTEAAAPPVEEIDFLPWKGRTSAILQKYTTSASIPVPDFVDNSMPKPISTTTDRVKARLEELESSRKHEEAHLLQLNQSDYIAHIQALNNELKQAWHNEERVKALKIVIQCSKCLADTSVPQFYPSMFVCVTEILDTFGELVWERLKRKAVAVDPATGRPTHKLPDNFTVDDVSEEARETAKNWFYKIASVRELLPRLYVELAILRCTRFVWTHDISKTLLRHAAMIRGIGDPMIAAYARAYLFRIGIQASRQASEYQDTSLFDLLFTFQQLESAPLQEYLQRFDLPKAVYMDLYSPAVQWMMDVYARNATAQKLSVLLQQYRKYCNQAFMLHHIIAAFPSAVVAQLAGEIAVLSRDADTSTLSRDLVYTALGARLAECAPSGKPTEVLNEVWKVVTKFTDPVSYMNVAQIWIEYPLKHLTMRDVGIMLGDILRHINVDHAYEAVQPQLQAIVQRILAREGALERVLSFEAFVGLVDLFQSDARISICVSVMEAFANAQPTNDPVIVNAIFHNARTLHDTLNSTSLQDERRTFTNLIKQFIMKIDFGQDFEAQLNFYVECRQWFANLDPIKSLLVRQACSLAMRTLHMVKGNHSKRTLAFVKAALAFCHITIPSMTDWFGRLYLFLLAGQVALHHQLLSQAEAFLKSAVTLLPDVPQMLEEDSQMKFTSDALSSFVATFFGMLVVVPGHPENGPLYLVHGLLNVVRQYPWEKGSDGKARALLNAIQMLNALAQDKLPYHIPKIDSNDVLYGAEPEYKAEVLALLNALVDELMGEMKILGDDSDRAAQRRQASLALDLYNLIVSETKLDAKLAGLAYNLFGLAKRVGAPDSYLRSSLAYTATGHTSLHRQLHAKLSA